MFSRSRRVLSETFDEHAAAVRSWLDKLVIGMNLCPWAGKTDESGGIRVPCRVGRMNCTVNIAMSYSLVACKKLAIARQAEVVTSLGSAPSEVLEDLQREASALPCEPDARPGAATTSLVVCPHVKAWQVQF